MLHQSGTMDHNTSIARAKFIDQSVETRQAFNFASPVEILRALQVYCCSHYGSMLWNLQGGSAQQYFRSWTTAIKLAWGCPRGTRTYLVQQVLACGAISAETDIMARYCKFFQGLRQSPSTEVSILANLLARDKRSCTGRNVSYVMDKSGCDVWSDSPGKVKAALHISGEVDIAGQDLWRVNYLETLLQHRQQWHYLGDKDEEQRVQTLIDSLCVN